MQRVSPSVPAREPAATTSSLPGLKITELRTDFRLNRSDEIFDSEMRAVFQYEIAGEFDSS